MPHPFFGAKDVSYIEKGGQIKSFSWRGELVVGLSITADDTYVVQYGVWVYATHAFRQSADTLQNYQPDYQPDHQLRADSSNYQPPVGPGRLIIQLSA